MRTVFLLLAAFLVGVPAFSAAQGVNSSITGVARDTSGGVLPGVTVEAASPALIDKVRTAVSDAQGLYRIVDLRPGDYSVTFTLPGFRTFRRDGIVLPANFVATVNGDMSLGALEETITVTGEASLVDVQSTQQQAQFQRETLAAIPGTGTNYRTGQCHSRRRARGADGLQRGWRGRHRSASIPRARRA
ncbi:MAG: carboxypeptidase regulatory-like domain-containing protein [Acidobacteria bacterium]|nr:carboxypeptidase regulatory-like domain-containing protein [Acidobacteriota bacterium]